MFFPLLLNEKIKIQLFIVYRQNKITFFFVKLNANFKYILFNHTKILLKENLKLIIFQKKQ